MSTRKAAPCAIIVLISCLFECQALLAAPQAVPTSLEELKEQRSKILVRRRTEAAELIKKVESKLSLKPANEQEAQCLARVRRTYYQLVMTSGSLSEDNLSAAAELLSDLALPYKPISAEDREKLTKSYKQLASKLDDLILVKDLEPELAAHDRLVTRAALGLWDAEKIASEIDRIENMLASAPDIPYGRQEILRNLAGKRLAAVDKGCYLGLYDDAVNDGDRLLVGSQRNSVDTLENGAGALVPLVSATVLLADALHLSELDSANELGRYPLSPPISLWAKSRLLEGHIPVINFQLPATLAPGDYYLHHPCQAAATVTTRLPTTLDSANPPGIQDVLDGRLDDYFNKCFRLIASWKAPCLVGLFNQFDSTAVATAFGSNGRTAYWAVIDPKLGNATSSKKAGELESKLARAGLTKDNPDLRTHFGDPGVPDGPERVSQAWKRIVRLAREAGARQISFYSTAASLHGNKRELSKAPLVGAQEWNNLAYYWPGDGVLDWLGIEGVWTGEPSRKKALSFSDCLDNFIAEARTSPWRATPLLVNGIAPAPEDPLNEEAYVTSTWFELSRSYPDIKACMISFPFGLTLWSPTAMAAFRRNPAGNNFFKPRLNLVPVTKSN